MIRNDGKRFEKFVRESLSTEGAVVVRLHDARSGVMTSQPADFIVWCKNIHDEPFLIECKDYPDDKTLKRKMFRPAQYRGIPGLRTVVAAHLADGISLSMMDDVKNMHAAGFTFSPSRKLGEHMKLSWLLSVVLGNG